MLTVDWTTRNLDADPLHLRPIRDEDLEFILGLYQDWRVAQHLNRITVLFTHQDARELLDAALREAAGSVRQPSLRIETMNQLGCACSIMDRTIKPHEAE